MKFPWSRKREPQVIEEMKREAEEAKRSIEMTQPIVEEAVRRTDGKFAAVEEETRRASLEVALLRDLKHGWARGH